MSKVAADQGLEYFSTHPSHGKRIENIAKWLPEAKLRKENTDCTKYNLDSFWRW